MLLACLMACLPLAKSTLPSNKNFFQLGRCWSEVFSSVKVQVKVRVQELQVQVKTR